MSERDETHSREVGSGVGLCLPAKHQGEWAGKILYSPEGLFLHWESVWLFAMAMHEAAHQPLTTQQWDWCQGIPGACVCLGLYHFPLGENCNSPSWSGER